MRQYGGSHARAYRRNPGFEIVGLVAPSPTRRDRLAAELGGSPVFDAVETVLEALQPEAVSINSYPDSHADYALAAIDAGAHRPGRPAVARFSCGQCCGQCCEE